MELKLDKKGIIFNTQKYSIYDGPGVRTIIFIKGCPLKCKWCSNPEGISQNFDIMYVDDRCTKCGKCVSFCGKGIHNIKKVHDGTIVHKIDREIKCDGCKLCQFNCPSEAVRIAGEEKTVEEIINIIEQDSLFYITSGGGVTLSGGEVASQPEFALEILKACKSRGINTAIETCGQASWEIYKELNKYVDLFLYDLKHIDPDEHKNLVGVNNYKILTNMAKLFSIGANITVRMPMVKGLNDQEWALKAAMKFINKISEGKNLKGVEILPYHKLGVNKYQQLDKEYSIKEDLTYSQSELEKIEDFVKEFNLPIQVVKH
jgi:pyruvate formate lyase activating enzyme